MQAGLMLPASVRGDSGREGGREGEKARGGGETTSWWLKRVLYTVTMMMMMMMMF